MLRWALAVAALVSAGGCGARTSADETVVLTLDLPDVGQLSAEYACPAMAEANLTYGSGPKPSFRTVTLQKAKRTFVVSTPDIPDRFCVADSYTGHDVSGPFNVFEISPAADGRYWFRDHGDTRPIKLTISRAPADRPDTGDAATVQFHQGDPSLAYRSGLVVPVVFRPLGNGMSPEDYLAAQEMVRAALSASAELEQVSAEHLCETFGDSFGIRLRRLPDDDIRKALLQPYAACASPGLPRGWPASIKAIDVVLGEAKPMQLDAANGWVYRGISARGAGVLVACTIGDDPCVRAALPDVEEPLRVVNLAPEQSGAVEHRPDDGPGVAAFYARSPDSRDSVIFVSNSLHTFNFSGVER